jgi:acetylglutamate kinase
MVTEAVRKSAVLVEALPYIKLFHDQVVVVKLGGSAQEDPEVLSRVLTDVDFMISVGMRPVIVYGGGKRISSAMARAGRDATFVHGQRITDPPTMEIVSRVLIDEIGHELLDLMRHAGGRGALLNGHDHGFLRAEKKHLPSHPEVDLQCVGTPVGVDVTAARPLLDDRVVPFVAPVAAGVNGSTGLFNVNGDTAAALIAREMEAAKLVLLSDIAGIYRDPDREDSLFSSLHERETEELIADGTISGGMIPKVEACIEAIKGGVGKAHIVSGYQPHALLLEIFTTGGVGTEIIQ